MDGDTLSLWCYATEELKPDDAPRIFLQDARDAGVTTISLLTGRDALPAGKWTEVRLPFASFLGPYGGTEDARFNARRVASITLLQNLEDNTEHTLFIDDISIIDGKAPKREPPEVPTKLTVMGYDRHFDLEWQPSKSGDLISYRIYRSWDGKIRTYRERGQPGRAGMKISSERRERRLLIRLVRSTLIRMSRHFRRPRKVRRDS